MKATPVPLFAPMLPKDHRLHVDGGTQRIRNTIDAPIIDGAAAHPGIENGLDGDAQLFVRIFRNRVLLGDDDLFFGGDDVAQVLRLQIGIATA